MSLQLHEYKVQTGLLQKTTQRFVPKAGSRLSMRFKTYRLVCSFILADNKLYHLRSTKLSMFDRL